MEIFYPADSLRLPLGVVQELNYNHFQGHDDGDMPFNDNDELPDMVRIISDDEFIANELENVK